MPVYAAVLGSGEVCQRLCAAPKDLKPHAQPGSVCKHDRHADPDRSALQHASQAKSVQDMQQKLQGCKAPGAKLDLRHADGSNDIVAHSQYDQH